MTNLFTSAITESFGEYLRSLRVSLGFSQKDIEALSGVSSLTLRRIEKGEVLPRFDTLRYLSIAFKKDLLEDLREYSNSIGFFKYYPRLENLIVSYDIKTLQNLSVDFEKFVEEPDKKVAYQ